MTVARRVYSKSVLLAIRSSVDSTASPPWTPRSRGDAFRELRLASADGRFEICDLTRMWEAVEPLIVRASEEISSPEIARLPVGAVFETTGLSRRVVVDGRGEVVRVQLILANDLPPSQLGILRESTKANLLTASPASRLATLPSTGWATATSTACGSDGRVYIGAPSTEAIHSAGFSAFLLSHDRRFLLTDDADVYPSAESTVPSARLHWGWHVQQFGLPHVSLDECEIRIRIMFPVHGWVVARRLHTVLPAGDYMQKFSASSFLRPYAVDQEDLPTGDVGCPARALITMQLRAEVETSAPVVGLDLFEHRVVQLAGPCVLTDFVAGDAVSLFIRAPVTDARLNLMTPRWATVGAVGPDGAVTYFMHVSGNKVLRKFNWNLRAVDFRPGRTVHTTPSGTGGSSAGPAGTGGTYSFPKMDGCASSYRVAVRVRGFGEAAGDARRTGFAFRVGQEVTQKSAVFWREETRHFQVEEGEMVETVAVQWMQVVEGGAWVPLMEISLFSGKYLKFLKRGDAVSVPGNKVQGAHQVVSIADCLEV